jgi:hypothetical protein
MILFIRRSKLFFPVALLLFSFSANAQKSDTSKTYTYYFAAAGGYYFLPIASLNSQLNAIGIKPGFKNSAAIGFDYGYKSDKGKKATVTALFSFHYLPTQYINTVTDSIKFRLNGFNMQLDWLSFNWIKSDNLTLTGGLAWVYGRLRVKQDSRITTISTNAYTGPEFRLEFNVRFLGHFYAGVRYAYRDDISKTGWKRTYENYLLGNGSYVTGIFLGGTRLSGTMIGAFIGFGK